MSGGGLVVCSKGGEVGIPACTEADPPGRDSYCCRWYTSYWNAFLFEGIFRGILSVTMSVAGEYQKILIKDKGLGAGIH